MKKVFSIMVLLALSSPALALTLKEKKQFKEWSDYLNSPDSSYVKTVVDKCGFEISATLEEKFTTPFMTEGANAASYCDEVRSKISSMCSDETSKDAIKAKVKKVKCMLAAKPEEASFKIAGGVLTFTYGVKASNLGDKVQDFLENNL